MRDLRGNKHVTGVLSHVSIKHLLTKYSRLSNFFFFPRLILRLNLLSVHKSAL